MDTKQQRSKKVPPSTEAIVRVPAVPVTVCYVQQYNPLKIAAEEALAAMTPVERYAFLKNLRGPTNWWSQ